MAVYTDVDDDDLHGFLAHYALGAVRTFKGIAEGVENSNFLLETDRGRFILTLFEKRVRAEDLPFFIALMRHLAQRGFPAPLPIEGQDGEALREVAGKPAVLVSFLEGVSPRRPTPAQCRALGAGLARLHLALSDFPLTRPNDLSLPAWSSLLEGREAAASALSPTLGEMATADLGEIARDWPTGLPSGAVHGDLFPDNAFFLGDELTGVIDFYFACTDALAYDVAVCLNAWAFEARGEYNATRGRALISGYESVRPLTADERAALPVLARGAAMRFFLTRLVDWSATPADALVRPKNPLDYAERLGFHRQARGPGDYGA